MQKKFDVRESFTLNGATFQIVSGAIHYFRIEPAYWEDRLQKVKDMGCNTIETYVPWNVHEPEKGKYQFSGQYDLIRFIQLAEQIGLYVILRASPYICAEWEFGGLPAWLLKDPAMRVRSLYEPFIQHLSDYFRELFIHIAPLQVDQAGPIILMQVENEYGYFSNEKAYLKRLVHIMKENGVTVPLVTSDSTRQSILNAGSIPGYALPTINCGSDLRERIHSLRTLIPNKPLMCMEFWIGWFNVWGGLHERRNLAAINQDLLNMLDIGHVNIYMIHGGTNFGFMNGANYYERVKDDYYKEEYAPATTSYDYGAPIDESGELTESYYRFQETIAKAFNQHYFERPTTPIVLKKAYGSFLVSDKVGLFEVLEDLASPIHCDYPVTMEMLDQAYGYILYQSQLGKLPLKQSIKLLGTQDRAHVFLNKTHQFTAYRDSFYRKEYIQLRENQDNQLAILVENMGRANFGPYLNDQRKGIGTAVMLDEYQQSGWDHFCLPLDNLANLDFEKAYQSGLPAFYRITFEIDQAVDTYLALPGWGKGVVFLNNFNLGRFWEEGPQQSLYVPAPKLNIGKNELIIFETEGKAASSIEFVAEHVLMNKEDHNDGDET
ncbi:beta-galactosidase [Amphibacillus marinus]|uniref:Beta-galactosidase n=1 Tax=Amphibacillus marinus TaxID=872970 RepID=A0A1H8H6A4_9BACI|nr:beta-galactosidase family protein [Amphibacillus marinus]SEN51540.1 beta-galactosidase [Amphibacillus marinus]